MIDLITFYPKLKSFYKPFLEEGSPLILDVGCNRGQSIDLFLSINKNARIIAFEPNKRLYEALVSKYSDNKNIKIHNLGVSNQSGSLTFNENIFDETSTFEDINLDSKYLKKKAKVLGVAPEDIIAKSYEVEVVDLATFLKDNGLKEIDVIKIDVEGHEYACLKGLFPSNQSTANVKLLQLEKHFDDMYDLEKSSTSKSQLLKDCGFALAFTVKNSLADYEEVIYERKS